MQDAREGLTSLALGSADSMTLAAAECRRECSFLMVLLNSASSCVVGSFRGP